MLLVVMEIIQHGLFPCHRLLVVLISHVVIDDKRYHENRCQVVVITTVRFCEESRKQYNYAVSILEKRGKVQVVRKPLYTFCSLIELSMRATVGFLKPENAPVVNIPRFGNNLS